MQLDLFTHSRDIMLQNDVIAALRMRDPVAGKKAFAVLEPEYPLHENLAPLTTLLNVLAAPVQRSADHGDAAEKLQFLEAVVTPAANRIFGERESGMWLAPLWRSMAEAATGLPFNAGLPNTHAAFPLLQSGDWAAAESAIAGIPSWRRIPAPLAWMAEVNFHRGGLERAWHLLMELAWIDADTFNALAHRLKSPPLHKLLRVFDGAFDDEPAPGHAWFPAWLLVTAPAMATVLRETQTCNGKAPERTARLIAELLALEKQGRHADIVARRKTFRDLHAGLYGIYIASR